MPLEENKSKLQVCSLKRKATQNCTFSGSQIYEWPLEATIFLPSILTTLSWFTICAANVSSLNYKQVNSKIAFKVF